MFFFGFCVFFIQKKALSGVLSTILSDCNNLKTKKHIPVQRPKIINSRKNLILADRILLGFPFLFSDTLIFDFTLITLAISKCYQTGL